MPNLVRYGGGGGGDSGSRFIVNFGIEGNGVQQLNVINQHFVNITGTIQQAGEAADKVSKKFSYLKLAIAFEEVIAGAKGAIDIGMGFFQAWGDGFVGLLTHGAEFEQMLVRIQSFGKTQEQAVGLMHESVELASKMPLAEKDMVRLMQALEVSGVSAFQHIGGSYEELAAKKKTLPDLSELIGIDEFKKNGPQAITVLADALAAAGQLGPGDVGIASQELSRIIEAGKVGTRLTRFGPLTEALHRVAKAAGGAQGRMEALYNELGKTGTLGTAEASMMSLTGQLSNLRGILDLITINVMEVGTKGGLQNQFVKGFKVLVDTVREFFSVSNENGKQFIASLKEIGRSIMGPVVTSIKFLSSVLREVFMYISRHPSIVKFGLALASIASAALILVGSLTVLFATVGAGVLMLMAFPMILTAIKITAIAVGVSLATLTAVFGSLLAGYLLWESNFAGIKSLFQDIGTVIDAVYESFNNIMEGLPSISDDTYNKLKNRGLLQIFLETMNVLYQLQRFWEGFQESFDRKWDVVGAKFAASWDRISGTFERITQAIRNITLVIFGGIDHGAEAVDKMHAQGEDWGDIVINILDTLADVALASSAWVDSVVDDVPDLLDSLANVYEVTLDIVDATMLVYDIGKMTWNVIGLSMSGLLLVTQLVLGTVLGIVAAFVALLNLDFGAFDHIMDKVRKGSILGDPLKTIEMAGGFADKIGSAETDAERRIMSEGHAGAGDALRDKANQLRVGANNPQMAMDALNGLQGPYSPEYANAIEQMRKNFSPETLQKIASGKPIHITTRATIQMDRVKLGEMIKTDIHQEKESQGAHPSPSPVLFWPG